MIERAKAAGLEGIVVIGTGLQSSLECLALSEAHPGYLYATAGIHPHEVDDFDDSEWPALRALLEDDRIKGVGETGLDNFYDYGERQRQGALFSAHLQAAVEVNKPVVVHIRDAFEEAFRRTAEVGLGGGGVVHCFTGGPEECLRALELGYHISISGMVTFKNAQDLRAAVPLIPLDRLLVETDSPFLAPIPYRGKRNEPAYVVRVLQEVASLRAEPIEQIAAATVANTRRLFRLPQALAPAH